MSMILNPFLYATTALTSFFATADGSNADISDVGGIHSAGTFTIPSEWDGRKVRVSVGSNTSTTADVTTLKSSAQFDGSGYLSVDASAGNDGGTAHSAPVVVSTGDTFTVSGPGTGDGNWKAVELLPSGVKGALVNRVTSAFTISATLTAVEWNNEIYDTDAIHDTGTNPSRLTVQSGTSGLVRLQGSIQCNVTGELGIELRKNGSALTPSIQMDTDGTNICFISYPIAVSAGDYFELFTRSSGASPSVSVDANSWFSLEELPSSLQYAVAYASSTGDSIASGIGTPVAGTLNTQAVDVGGWFTPGQSKFTVISGVTNIRCGFFGTKSSGSGTVALYAYKNAATWDLMPRNSSANTSTELVHGCSPVAEVTAGDTIDFYFAVDAGAQSVGAGSLFWIEEVPTITS